MAARKKTTISRGVLAKARQLLAFAEERAAHAADCVELHNALFGLGGKATELLTTESERTAFTQTAECKQIFALLDRLPPPAVKDFGELLATANGDDPAVHKLSDERVGHHCRHPERTQDASSCAA